MSDMNQPPDQGSGQPQQPPQQPPQQWGQQPPPQQGDWGQQPPPPYPGGGGYAPPGAPMSQFGRPLAEWWKRLVAILIDGLILAIPVWIIFGLLFAGATTTVEVDPATGELTG